MPLIRILALLLALSLTPATLRATKPRDIGKVKKEQKATEKEIKETNRQLSNNERDTKRNLNLLNSISAEMRTNEKQIDKVRHGIDSLDRGIRSKSDSLRVLNRNLDRLRRTYIKSLRRMQGETNAVSPMAFVFSAQSYTRAVRRMRYLREFAAWRARRTAEITQAAGSVEAERRRLDELNDQRKASLNELNSAQQQLQTQRKQTDRVVARLKKDKTSLTKVLRQKEQHLRSLDRELDRLIALEQRRREEEEARRRRQAEEAASHKSGSQGKSESKSTANASAPKKSSATTSAVTSAVAEADRRLSGSFESNKGRLLFPVSGSYKIVRGFGRQKHPELEHVETENGGIDIEVKPGVNARAIFDGKVSAIFKQPGFNNIVMVRHGEYITIYANLASLNVKTGDPVKANQTIGSIYADPDDDNRAILHFELRKERAKLNPTLWVK